MRHSEKGFTVIELIAVIVLLGAASILFFAQKNNLEVAARDTQRKTAINAIYYNLEEVYYPQHQYYPSKLNAQELPAMDPSLLTDTNGVAIDDTTNASEYQYNPTNCNNNECKGYTLQVALENEAEYVKTSRHN